MIFSAGTFGIGKKESNVSTDRLILPANSKLAVLAPSSPSSLSLGGTVLYRRSEVDDTFVTAIVSGIQEAKVDVTIPMKEAVPFEELLSPLETLGPAEAPAPAEVSEPAEAQAPAATSSEMTPQLLDQAALKEGSKVRFGDCVGFITRVHGDGAFLLLHSIRSR